MDELIVKLLGQLELDSSDEGQVSFIRGVLEEDLLEAADKQEAILGIIEREDEDAQGAVTELIADAVVCIEEEKLRLEQEKLAKFEADEKAAQQDPKNKALSPEEERERKNALLKSYGYLEEEDPAPSAGGDEGGVVVDVDPRSQSKKQRKKADAKLTHEEILMRPNINAAAVKGAELKKRTEAAAAAQAKREKDKNDLKKQKDDAAKKIADRQKKAAKGERRA